MFLLIVYVKVCKRWHTMVKDTMKGQRSCTSTSSTFSSLGAALYEDLNNKNILGERKKKSFGLPIQNCFLLHIIFLCKIIILFTTTCTFLPLSAELLRHDKPVSKISVIIWAEQVMEVSFHEGFQESEIWFNSV